MGTTKLTDEQVSKLDEMLRKITRKNQHKIMMDPEDVLSELWINALKIINDKGEVNMPYIAAASHNHIVSMVRANVKDEHLSYDVSIFERCLPAETRMKGDNGEESSEYITYTFCTNASPEESEIEVFEILDLFEKGSKERLFVETWMKVLGVLPSEHPEEIPQKAIERYIAKDIMGYAGSSSNGYGRVKWRVREVLVANGYRLHL